MAKQKIQLSDHFNYSRLLRFVLPCIGTMLFTSIYGIVDGLCVSNFVGKTAFAAVNLIMPLPMLIGTVGFMLGTGGSAIVGITLGEGDEDKANRYFSLFVLAAFLAGVALSVLGLFILRPVAILMGAKGEMLDFAVRYGRVLMVSVPTFILQNMFQSFFVTAEKPTLGFWFTVGAGCTNMVLDVVLVGWLRWGVEGAAIATFISQIVGGVLPLVYFLRPNSSLLQLTKTKLELRPILQASGNGASELVSNVTASVVGMLYNFQLLRLAGQNGVAAFGVLMYVEFIFAAVFIGYAIGCAPIVSYHFGAGNRGELQNLLRKSILLMGVGGLAMVGVAQGLAEPMARLFVGYDDTLCQMTVHAFRIATLSFVLVGFNIFASSFFTALNDGVVSAIISFLRTFVFKLSAVLLLPLIWELDGIWWAEVAAEICAFGLGMAFLLGKRKKYGYM